MSVDLLDYYQKRLAEIPTCKYVNLSCEVDYPAISYNIHSFGDERGERSLQTLQWDKAAGVDAFFSFDTSGIVEYPKEFEHTKCQFLLNALGSLDRFSLLENGSIGDGWFERDTFLLRLYLSPDVTRGLMEQMKSARNFDDHRKKFSIRFDLFDVARRDQRVSYSICRVYCFP